MQYSIQYHTVTANIQRFVVSIVTAPNNSDAISIVPTLETMTSKLLLLRSGAGLKIEFISRALRYFHEEVNNTYTMRVEHSMLKGASKAALSMLFVYL